MNADAQVGSRRAGKTRVWQGASIVTANCPFLPIAVSAHNGTTRKRVNNNKIASLTMNNCDDAFR